MESGRLDDGLRAVAEALAAGEANEDRQDEPERHRVKGELLLRQDDSNAAEAQSCFQRAIEIARKQSAKSWELRATMSLARLLAKQGRRDEARTMLADIYNWFTEGFDTADLKDAKALLDELGRLILRCVARNAEATIRRDANLCGKCGARSLTVPECGASANRPGERFCGECGTALGASSATVTFN